MVLILILIKTETATPFLIADLELDLLKVQGAVNHFGLIRDAGAGIVHHLLQHLRYGPLKVWADSLGLLSHGVSWILSFSWQALAKRLAETSYQGTDTGLVLHRFQEVVVQGSGTVSVTP